MTSPTQLSLKELRKRGYLSAVVEKFNPFVKIRQDLFGFADIIAVHPDKKEFLLIQATTGEGGMVAERVRKLNEHKNVQIWKQAGGKVSVWGWAKRGKAGKRKIWTLREVEIG